MGAYAIIFETAGSHKQRPAITGQEPNRTDLTMYFRAYTNQTLEETKTALATPSRERNSRQHKIVARYYAAEDDDETGRRDAIVAARAE